MCMEISNFWAPELTIHYSVFKFQVIPWNIIHFVFKFLVDLKFSSLNTIIKLIKFQTFFSWSDQLQCVTVSHNLLRS